MVLVPSICLVNRETVDLKFRTPEMSAPLQSRPIDRFFRKTERAFRNFVTYTLLQWCDDAQGRSERGAEG